MCHNILSKDRCKKERKNVDAIAPTSYDQSLNEHNNFYITVYTVDSPYFLLSAISIHRIPHESQVLMD